MNASFTHLQKFSSASACSSRQASGRGAAAVLDHISAADNWHEMADRQPLVAPPHPPVPVFERRRRMRVDQLVANGRIAV
jgi:hypothetical protein